MELIGLWLGRMVCANGETIEWTLRVGDRVVARCWRGDDPAAALQKLLGDVARGAPVP